MKEILAEANRDVLARFAWSSVLIALDFDGTLAPITERPADSQMRAATRALLVRLTHLYPVAVISGRARADVSTRFAGIPVVAISGNHGLEPGRDLARYRRMVQRWSRSLKSKLGDLAGVEIEEKTFSLAVHYRRSREKRQARAAIIAAVASLGAEVRAIAGKLVLNVVPAGAPHKGEALRRLRREAHADTAIYVGDDVTDEDVFSLDEPGRLLGIRVGRKQRSAANWYLRSQRDMDALLRRLLEERSAARPARGHR